jgi:hypothetical protein
VRSWWRLDKAPRTEPAGKVAACCPQLSGRRSQSGRQVAFRPPSRRPVLLWQGKAMLLGERLTVMFIQAWSNECPSPRAVKCSVPGTFLTSTKPVQGGDGERGWVGGVGGPRLSREREVAGAAGPSRMQQAPSRYAMLQPARRRRRPCIRLRCHPSPPPPAARTRQVAAAGLGRVRQVRELAVRLARRGHKAVSKGHQRVLGPVAYVRLVLVVAHDVDVVVAPPEHPATTRGVRGWRGDWEGDGPSRSGGDLGRRGGGGALRADSWKGWRASPLPRLSSTSAGTQALPHTPEASASRRQAAPGPVPAGCMLHAAADLREGKPVMKWSLHSCTSSVQSTLA